jgi:tetratricopeptide (TPR) repeat protein
MRWSLSPLVAILIVCSPPAFADVRGDCLAHRDYEVRIKSCSEIIHSEPDNAIAYHNRGIAHQSKGDLERALADFDKAIQLDPSYRSAYDARGRIYATKGDYARALADVTRASELAVKTTSALPAKTSERPPWKARPHARVHKTSKVAGLPVPKPAKQVSREAWQLASAPAATADDSCGDASADYPKWDPPHESPR